MPSWGWYLLAERGDSRGLGHLTPLQHELLKPIHQSPAVLFFKRILPSFSTGDSALLVQNFHPYRERLSAWEVCQRSVRMERKGELCLKGCIHPVPCIHCSGFFCSSAAIAGDSFQIARDPQIA